MQNPAEINALQSRRRARLGVVVRGMSFVFAAGVGLCGLQAAALASDQAASGASANVDVVQLWRQLFDFVGESRQRQPVVIVGLVGIVLLPLLVLAGMVLRLVLDEGGRSTAAQSRIARSIAANAIAHPTGYGSLQLQAASGQSVSERPVRLARDLMQIGREGDNDICIPDDTVHRYHAVIECSRDDGFVITDVSGPEGNGVRINGQRLIKSSLADGDVVEIGRARLRFATLDQALSPV